MNPLWKVLKNTQLRVFLQTHDQIKQQYEKSTGGSDNELFTLTPLPLLTKLFEQFFSTHQTLDAFSFFILGKRIHGSLQTKSQTLQQSLQELFQKTFGDLPPIEKLCMEHFFESDVLLPKEQVLSLSSQKVTLNSITSLIQETQSQISSVVQLAKDVSLFFNSELTTPIELLNFIHSEAQKYPSSHNTPIFDRLKLHAELSENIRKEFFNLPSLSGFDTFDILSTLLKHHLPALKSNLENILKMLCNQSPKSDLVTISQNIIEEIPCTLR